MIIWSCIYQRERCFPFNIMTGRGGRPKVWTQTPQTAAPSMPATQMLEGTICFSYAFELTLNVILVHNKNECSVFQMHLLSSSFHTRWLYIMLKPHIQYASAHWSCWKWPCIFFFFSAWAKDMTFINSDMQKCCSFQLVVIFCFTWV